MTEPDVDLILALAAIIRKVDGNHDLGAAALAEGIICAWNADSDEFNTWDTLGTDEKVKHAQAFYNARTTPTTHRRTTVMALETWKSIIAEEMSIHDDSWDNVVSCTLTEEELHESFDAGYGGIEGKSFTLWTETRVYFPIVYDGAEWVKSASRNPDGKPTEHFGSW